MPDAQGNLTADEMTVLQNLGNYSYYLNPNIGSLNTNSYSGGSNSGGGLNQYDYGIGSLLTGGMAGFADSLRTGDAGLGILDLLSGGVGSVIRSFFGNDGPSWQPYAQDGMYVWHDPQTDNPVPVSGIPGVRQYPTDEYLNMANQIRAVSDLLPYYSQAISGQAIPAAQAQLAAETATSGPRLALMTDLYKKYGPQLNEIGNQIALQNALASAERDSAVISGPGQELVRQALDTAKIYDPEYFATRELTANRLGDLMNSIDLGSGLSSTEMDTISKGLAREGDVRGTANAPSNWDTIANATTYGEAGRNREVQNKNLLSQAIQASTQFLPAAKSGVDVFQVATGRSSTPNTGESKFTGINDVGNAAQQNASNLLNTQTSLYNTNQNVQLQRDLAEKDWADYLGQVTSSLGNIAGGVLGFI